MINQRKYPTQISFHIKATEVEKQTQGDLIFEIRRPRQPIQTSKLIYTQSGFIAIPDHHMMYATFIKSTAGKWKTKIFYLDLLCPLHSIGGCHLNLKMLMQTHKLKFRQSIHTTMFGAVTISLKVHLGIVPQRSIPIFPIQTSCKLPVIQPKQVESIASYFEHNKDEKIEATPQLFQHLILSRLRAHDDNIIHELIDIFNNETTSLQNKLYLLVISLHVQSWISEHLKNSNILNKLKAEMVKLFVRTVREIVKQFENLVFEKDSLKSTCLTVIKWFVEIGRGPKYEQMFSAMLSLFAVSFGKEMTEQLCEGLLVKDKKLMEIARAENKELDARYEEMAKFVLY